MRETFEDKLNSLYSIKMQTDTSIYAISCKMHVITEDYINIE